MVKTIEGSIRDPIETNCAATIIKLWSTIIKHSHLKKYDECKIGDSSMSRQKSSKTIKRNIQRAKRYKISLHTQRK